MAYSVLTLWRHYGDRTLVLCVLLQVAEMASMLVLFSMFYKKTYTKKKPAAAAADSTGAVTTSATTAPKAQPAAARTKDVPAWARYACVCGVLGIFALWWVFLVAPLWPSGDNPVLVMHSWRVPAFGTIGYLAGLPLLKYASSLQPYDPKVLLKEAMFVYNAAQVALNGWMVWVTLRLLFSGRLPFVWDNSVSLAAPMLWVHYCDKYLEFLDTAFMVLRGRYDQVSFLHVYHHTSIGWCWWIALQFWWKGDAYFGALLNSAIHVAMYSHYAVALLGKSTPWKKWLTKAQLLQFASVSTDIYMTARAHTVWG